MAKYRTRCNVQVSNLILYISLNSTEQLDILSMELNYNFLLNSENSVYNICKKKKCFFFFIKTKTKTVNIFYREQKMKNLLVLINNISKWIFYRKDVTGFKVLCCHHMTTVFLWKTYINTITDNWCLFTWTMGEY